MKKLLLLLATLCLIFSTVSAKQHRRTHHSKKESSYPYNPLVPKEIWDKASPHFLPSSHEIKKTLDMIFSTSRATASREALIAAGFFPPKLRNGLGKINIAWHPNINGYLIKTYYDDQPPKKEADHMLSRIKGAKLIKDYIKKHGWQSDFVVPKKWIYPLPKEPLPPSNIPLEQRKYFVLVAEDMHILSNDESKECYKTLMSKEKLQHLFSIISDLGLNDSIGPNNIPFNQLGQICFVDTDKFNNTNVNFASMLQYFSDENKVLWQSFIDAKKGEH